MKQKIVEVKKNVLTSVTKFAQVLAMWPCGNETKVGQPPSPSPGMLIAMPMEGAVSLP